MKVLSLLFLAGSASAIRMSAVGKTDSADASGPCGGKFANLIQAQQDYVNSMHKVWTTDWNQGGFPEFKKELQCWMTRLQTTNCGGVTKENGGTNAKWLREVCTTNSQKVTDWYQVWKKFDAGFKASFTKEPGFPGKKQAAVDGKGRWKMQALMDFGGKFETLCASYCFCADDKGRRTYGEKKPFCGA